ncbi:putative immune-type receptor 12a precursor, partial [Clarias magur]
CVCVRVCSCFCVTGLLTETLCSLTLDEKAGVTIWCEFNPNLANYISWFKQTNDSVPRRLACKQFFKTYPAKNCYFFTDSDRIEMSVYDKNTSLTITAVNVSDTGIYYCAYSEEIILSNSTSLHVKAKKVKTYSQEKTGSDSSAVFLMLTLVFGALTVILLSVLIFILKHRKNSH